MIASIFTQSTQIFGYFRKLRDQQNNGYTLYNFP